MQQAIPWEKIKALETEIRQLKSVGKRSKKKLAKKGADSLFGLLKGIRITEKDIREAKKSLFPYDYK